MATVEEVLAKADAWEKAGNSENAAKLRAYAETLQPAAPKYDRTAVEAKAAEWEKAGQTDKAAKLREFATTLPSAEAAKPEGWDSPDAPPPQGFPGTPESDARAVAEFEKFNPELKGRYKTFAELPKVGTSAGISGGTSRSGGIPLIVREWQGVGAKQGTFGDTAAAMVAGPMEGARAFGAGIMDSSVSPSRDFLANDPLTKNLPSWMLTGMGKVADVGGAGLSIVGAGLAGATGLGAELVPGQNAADERKLAEETLAMSMFAVPELAGASSVPARMASAAPRAAVSAAPRAGRLAGDVAAAERIGIPVLRSDVKPPATALGKVAQRVGESIPFAGTAGMRAKQFGARVDAVADFVSKYVGDAVMPAIDAVTESFRKVHGKTVEKYAAQKNAVIEGAAGAGAVPMTRTFAAIDGQIAKFKAAKNDNFAPIIAELENLKKAMTDQRLPQIDLNRANLGEVFKGISAEKIKSAGEKALTAIYGPIKEDMAAFIKTTLGEGALNKWNFANERLSGLATEVQGTGLKTVLKSGEVTPEVARGMLFSQKPSDLRLLYRSLDEDGRKAARTAIVQEAVVRSGGADALSVERFKNALDKLSSQIGEFFKAEDLEAAQGLARALKLTEQAGKAGAAPLTGVQNLPILGGMLATDVAGGMGGATAILGTIGGIARIYEATGVKAALRRLAKMETPKAQRVGLQMLDQALRKAGLPAAGQQGALPMAVGQN